MSNSLDNLRPILSLILNALDRDYEDGKLARGEMAQELRNLLNKSENDDVVKDYQMTNEDCKGWIAIQKWEDLPIGTWLTKTEGDNRPYNIAEVALNFQKQKMIIVGGHFSFDMDNPVAYTDFEKYKND